jgi:carbamoyltransferase
MRTEMDVLVIDDFILYKNEQPEFEDKINWQQEFTLD